MTSSSVPDGAELAVSHPKKILFTVDVEDWFQVENFKGTIPFSDWPGCELRVERNTNLLLDLLDSATCKCICERREVGKPRATFFVLGWVAERLPHLVKEIQGRGHEVASHGYCHTLCRSQCRADLVEDLCRSKALLEDILGSAVHGYRAPSFSICNDVLKRIQDCGYRYDSSFNSFALNKRYGQVSLPVDEKNGLAYLLDRDFYEIPISNLQMFGRQFPLGGGGYFRLIPSQIFHRGIRSILEKDNGYLFYIHPWELDPSQPRVEKAPAHFKFRHYLNLNRTQDKLQSFFREFQQIEFATCSDYLGIS